MVEAYFYHRPFYGHGMEMTVLLSRWAVEGCSEAIFAKLSGQCLTHSQVLIMSSSIPLLLLLLLLLLRPSPQRSLLVRPQSLGALGQIPGTHGSGPRDGHSRAADNIPGPRGLQGSSSDTVQTGPGAWGGLTSNLEPGSPGRSTPH